MAKALRIVVIVLALASASLAQDLFQVQVRGKQRWPVAEAEKVYISACSIVQQEFRTTQPVRPQVVLVLGADSDEVFFDKRQIRLTKWNAYLFAEGVAILAVEDLMNQDKVRTIARRAVNWADSTLEIKTVPKQTNTE